MNRHFDDQGFNDSGLTMRPSELFQRNCWISFEPVEGSLSVLADYIGPHKILWATDYPHPDGFFPGAPKLIADRPELSAATKRQILAGGALGFYGLKEAQAQERENAVSRRRRKDSIAEDGGARPGSVQGVPRVRPEGLQGRRHSGEDQGAHRPRDRADHPVSLVHRRPHEKGRDGRRLGRGDCRDDLRLHGHGRRGRVEPRRARAPVPAGAQGAQGLSAHTAAALDLDDLRSHIGRAQTATDVPHPGPANFLRLALGRPEPEYREGDSLPPAWLALYFLPRVAADALRPHGSPRATGVAAPGWPRAPPPAPRRARRAAPGRTPPRPRRGPAGAAAPPHVRRRARPAPR